MQVRKSHCFLASVLMSAAGFSARGDIVIDFVPSVLTVPVGDTFDIDVVISGLGVGAAPSVGAFDFDILFNDAVLSLNSLTFGDPLLGDQIDLSGLAMPGIDLGYSVSAPGVIDVFEFSLDTEAFLNANQADEFVMFRMSFDAIAAGFSALSIDDNDHFFALLDASGLVDLPATLNDGGITVIPAPGAAVLAMLGVGFVGLRLRRWA
ncbi:MAG: hypothetical protein C4547_07385 [Phycisphaerales bacterium]|nr:MAG: hypothetical protein C4547_07385 [Phycisphaerales bacterium]